VPPDSQFATDEGNVSPWKWPSANRKCLIMSFKMLAILTASQRYNV